MNTRLYNILIFFLVLSTAILLFQNIIRFQLGPQIFFLDTFGWWFLVTSITNFAGSILLLKYYQYQKYRFALVAGTISTISNFCYAIIIFIMLEFQKLANYNFPVLFISLITSIAYAISLILLNAKRKYWLSITGIFMFGVGLLFLITVVRVMYFRVNVFNNTIEEIGQWTALAGSLIPVLFILHFLSERKKLNPGNTQIPMQKHMVGMSGLAIVCLILTLSFGAAIFSEYRAKIYWARHNLNITRELAKLFEFRIFTNSMGDTLMYRLLRPLNYDSTKKYPLVVSLPYGGQPGTDTIRQIEGAAAAELLSLDSNRKKYPAFLFIPHCPPGGGWGGILNYPSVDSLVYEAISSLDDKFNIDTKRRYVSGISKGGYGTWNFICTRPDMFAAAIPVSGGGNPSLASKAVDVAVWAFHGKNDNNVPVEGSRNMISALEKEGGHPKYTEFPNKGHDIWYEVSITPGLLDWLFAQKRD
ncbi:MAG: carboxylesterase family protein [Flavisolibacter sp.]